MYPPEPVDAMPCCWRLLPLLPPPGKLSPPPPVLLLVLLPLPPGACSSLLLLNALACELMGCTGRSEGPAPSCCFCCCSGCMPRLLPLP